MVSARTILGLALGIGAALSAASGSMAQQQDDQPFYELVVEPDNDSIRVNEADGQARFTITIGVRPQQNIDNDPTQIDYRINDDTGPPPAGWSEIRIVPTTRKGPPSETFTVEVSIRLQSLDLAQEDVDIQLTIVSDPQVDPTLEPVYANLAQNDQETLTLHARRALTGAEAVTTWADQNKYWMLGGAVAVILMGVVLVHRRRGIDASVDQSRVDVVAGRTVDVKLHVRNKGSRPERVRISKAEPKPGWSVRLGLQEIELAPRASQDVLVGVAPPRASNPGDSYRVELFAAALSRKGNEEIVEFDATVRQGQLRRARPANVTETPAEVRQRPKARPLYDEAR